MSRDPHVRKSGDYLRAPVLAAAWGFRPPVKTPLALEIADFCKYVFFERNEFRRVGHNAFRYVRDGFYLLEVTDDNEHISRDRFPLHPGKGWGYVYTGFHERPAWTVKRWIQSKENPAQLEAVEQWITGSDGEAPRFATIPADRLIRWTWEQEGGNFAGVAPWRSAYGAWHAKLLFQIVDAIRHDRQGSGLPVMKIPPEATDEDIDAAEELLVEMRSHEHGYILEPNGFAFRWENGGDLSDALAQSIERCNRDIAYNVGFGHMLLGNLGKTGSFGLASTQDGNANIGIEEHAWFYGASWNIAPDGWSPVRRLVEENYGPGAPVPILVARNLPTRDWSKYLPQLPGLVQARLLTPDDQSEEYLREAITFPPHDPDSAREVNVAGIKPPPATKEEPEMKEAA